MISDATKLFSSSDLERIATAVGDVERKISGEIVPYVVAESDRYPESPWRCAAILGGAAVTNTGLLPFIAGTWPSFGISAVALVGLAAGFLGWIAGEYVTPIRRMMAGRGTMLRRSAARAAEAFVAEEIFATRERTGILIFLSVFERRVVVLGDAGINARVQGNEWNDMVAMVVDGVRAGRPAEGLTRAIAAAGELLLRHGFVVGPEDTNELPDTLRFGRTERSKDS
jgi:putative membrane protein